MIICTGVAGGINPKYKIGDIVVGIRVFQHDYGFLGDEGLVVCAIGTMPQVGLGTGKESIYQTIDVGLDISVALKEQKRSLKTIKTNTGTGPPQIHLGTIATGDQFVTSKKKIQELEKLDADAIEMEGASVCFVASQNNVPCYLIRAISDSANEDAIADFSSFLSVVAENNARVLESILDQLSNRA